MNIDLCATCGGPVLAGALNGRAALHDLLAVTANEPNRPTLVFLDFKAIELATASYLRESILAFRDVVRARRSKFYPVVANTNEYVRDEFVGLLQGRGEAIMACRLGENNIVTRSDLLGELGPKQRITFELVGEYGETDAGTLMRDHGQREGLKHTTAWNNRLTSLAALGLIVEQSQGRARRYRPLFEGN